jgi:ATP-dependent Lhr-like helicase
VPDRGIARRHRLQVGTIVSDAAACSSNGSAAAPSAQIEEGFIARLNKGDCFVFAGRVLEYVRTQDMAAYVRLGHRRRRAWCRPGPAARCRCPANWPTRCSALLDDAAQGRLDVSGPEMAAAGPMLQAQMRLSHLPRLGRLLVEQWRSREGHHLFIYPFAGRNVHMGLAQPAGLAAGAHEPNTFSHERQ